MKPRLLIIGNQPDMIVNFRGRLIEDLQTEGYDIHVAAPHISRDNCAASWFSTRGIKCHEIPIDRAGKNPFIEAVLLAALIKLILRVRPSTVLAVTIKPVIWGLLAAWLARVPGRYGMITGLGYAFIEIEDSRRSIVLGLVKRLYRTAIIRSTGIIFQNHDDKELFLRQNIMPTSTRATVVNGSGVDLEGFPYHPPRSDTHSLTFLYIGRLLYSKGLAEYAAAARILKEQYPGVRFQIVGPKDFNPDAIAQTTLEDWTSDGSVEWLGPQRDVRPFLRECHVFVLPSYREGTPRSSLEALATGRPVITTDAPGCRETVIEGANGYTVPVKDVHSLVSSMKTFILEPERVEVMGRASRAHAESKFEVGAINRNIIKFLQTADTTA